MPCFLQFLAVFELVRAKCPQGRPALITLDFSAAESSSGILAKAIQPVYPGVFCDILRLFEGYFWKRARV